MNYPVEFEFNKTPNSCEGGGDPFHPSRLSLPKNEEKKYYDFQLLNEGKVSPHFWGNFYPRANWSLQKCFFIHLLKKLLTKSRAIMGKHFLSLIKQTSEGRREGGRGEFFQLDFESLEYL